MGETLSRAGLFTDPEEKPKKDYDPEADVPADEDNDQGSSEGEDELAGTEHYVSVGKSKLRQKEPVSLGPQYRGSRVSRDALEQISDEEPEDEDDAEDEEDHGGVVSGSEGYDDPDKADLEADHLDEDVEIDSDDAFAESDRERFADFTFRGSSKLPNTGKRSKRPTAADFLASSEDGDGDDGADADGISDNEQDQSEEEDQDGDIGGSSLFADLGEEDEDEDEDEDDEDLGEEDEDDDEDDDEEMDDDDDDDDDEDDNDDAGEGDDTQRAELRKIMSEGPKSIVATMSQAAKADADKGLAVRQQRRSFDSLLNMRIRLQKALVAVNSLGALEEDQDEAGQQPYQAAEEAAIKLMNAIGDFRSRLLPETAKAGQKRKWEMEEETPSQTAWDDLSATEERALSRRRKVLEKWSSKVRGTTAVTKTRRLGTTTTQSLVSVLDDQLLSTDQLVRRTRTPRSCAPRQAAMKVAEDADIYDDADFYQLLLKELVDQRSTDMSAPGAGSATVQWAAIKEAKTRKQVDRRASKGRKLRFTVHEKMQNFMAPEDRRGWEQDAVDRFFGTLFGQKMELREDAEASDDEMDVEEGGLRLFRS